MSGVCGRGMRKLFFACVGLFGLVAPAVAADVAVPAASYQLPVPVLYSWTGCFIGFNIGGVNTPATETPITPIIVGEGRKAMEFSRALFDDGVMATGIAFPTVPEGKARIRLILTSEHTRAQLDQALDKLESVAKRLGILQ